MTVTTDRPASLDLSAPVATRRRVMDAALKLFLLVSLGIALGTLITLLADLLIEGRPRLNLDLIVNMPSARPERAGIQSAILGSLWVVATTAAISIPTGVAGAIYLEEFARKERWYNRLIELNVQNLASVPSVVYGILGLAFIARGFLGLGFTVITAALILTLVVLPTVVIATREALRAVPSSLRQASLAVGATEWETVYRQVLPVAVPGIATGTILSTSRALGESAPLLLVGALTFVTFNPDGFDSPYTVLPLTIFRFISEARLEFRPLAAASSVVLLVMLLGLNSAAIYLRNRYEKKLR
ncbi:MAG: phosphate ABC transporter permease PstA [Acidimicrobiia bacterium]